VGFRDRKNDTTPSVLLCEGRSDTDDFVEVFNRPPRAAMALHRLSFNLGTLIGLEGRGQRRKSLRDFCGGGGRPVGSTLAGAVRIVAVSADDYEKGQVIIKSMNNHRCQQIALSAGVEQKPQIDSDQTG
jgi:hypothetical protein